MDKISSSDRTALIRLASILPTGSPERKAILAGLKVADDSLKDRIRAAIFALWEGESIPYQKDRLSNLAYIVLWDKWRSTQARYYNPKDVLADYPQGAAIVKAIRAYRSMDLLENQTPPAEWDDEFRAKLEGMESRAKSSLPAGRVPRLWPDDFK